MTVTSTLGESGIAQDALKQEISQNLIEHKKIKTLCLINSFLNTEKSRVLTLLKLAWVKLWETIEIGEKE